MSGEELSYIHYNLYYTIILIHTIILTDHHNLTPTQNFFCR